MGEDDGDGGEGCGGRVVRGRWGQGHRARVEGREADELNLARLASREGNEGRPFVRRERYYACVSREQASRGRGQPPHPSLHSEMRKKRTRRVVGRVVHALPPHSSRSLAENEDEHAASEDDDEAVVARGEPTHVLAKLELGDGPPELVIPEEDLVGRVERRGGPADEEEEVASGEGENDPEGRVGELCGREKGLGQWGGWGGTQWYLCG